jgi:hypothetical protein
LRRGCKSWWTTWLYPITNTAGKKTEHLRVVDWDNPENNDFTGPPIGADIARRQAAIARAEAAFKLPAP